MHVRIANLRWRGKRSRYSRRMRNPQIYVSGKRPIAQLVMYASHTWRVSLSIYHIDDKNGWLYNMPLPKQILPAAATQHYDKSLYYVERISTRRWDVSVTIIQLKSFIDTQRSLYRTMINYNLKQSTLYRFNKKRDIFDNNKTRE